MPTMNFRCSDEQKSKIEKRAKELGFDSVGAYIKFVTINSTVDVKITKQIADNREINSNIRKIWEEYKAMPNGAFHDMPPNQRTAIANKNIELFEAIENIGIDKDIVIQKLIKEDINKYVSNYHSRLNA